MSEAQLKRVSWLVAISVVIAGLPLAVLLPIGLFTLESTFFQAFWLLHLGLQSVAVGVGVLLISGLCKQQGRFRTGLLLILILFLVVVALQAAAPIVARDALIYHLAVPKTWLENNRVVEIPWHEYSYYPMLLSMGFTGFLQADLVWLTPWYHISFLFLTSVLVAAVVFSQTGERLISLISFFLCMTLPICIRFAPTPMADLGLALYFGAAFAIASFWPDAERNGKKFSIAYLVPAGAALGLAMSTKYNGVLAAAMLIPSFFIYARRSKRSFYEAFFGCAVLGVVSLLIFLPWPAKNVLWTANPFFPYLKKVFGGPQDYFGAFGALQPLDYHIRVYDYGWLDVVLMPLRMIFLGEDDNPKYYDGVLSPILMLGFVPVFTRIRRPWVLFSTLTVAFYFAFAVVSYFSLVRYHAPLLLIVVAMSTYGVRELVRISGWDQKKSIYLFFVAVHVMFAAYYSVGLLNRTGAVDYFAKQQTREQFLNRHVGEYPMIRFMNDNLPSDTKVYLLFTGNKFYLYDVDAQGIYFSANPILAWIRQAKDVDELASLFQRRRYQYLMAHVPRLSSVFQAELNDVEHARWTAFANAWFEPTFQQGAYMLWKIRPPEQAVRPHEAPQAEAS